MKQEDLFEFDRLKVRIIAVVVLCLSLGLIWLLSQEMLPRHGWGRLFRVLFEAFAKEPFITLAIVVLGPFTPIAALLLFIFPDAISQNHMDGGDYITIDKARIPLEAIKSVQTTGDNRLTVEYEDPPGTTTTATIRTTFLVKDAPAIAHLLEGRRISAKEPSAA